MLISYILYKNKDPRSLGRQKNVMELYGDSGFNQKLIPKGRIY